MTIDKKIYKNYVSPIDQKLEQFDRAEPLSASQKAEILKYKKIYELRDKPTFPRENEEVI